MIKKLLNIIILFLLFFSSAQLLGQDKNNNNDFIDNSKSVANNDSLSHLAIGDSIPSKPLSLGVDSVTFVREHKLVDVYNPLGLCVKQGVSFDEALNDLPRGIYIVDGKKRIVR